MFDYLIITAPTASTAEEYKKELRNCSQIDESTTLICISDPPGARLGSGGGTLNALSYISDPDLFDKSVAIIHCGGESKRAPLHSVCGKGFATFNAVDEDNEELLNPVLLLLAELQRFCREGANRQGFCVVASSDVLLDIHRSHSLKFPLDAVIVVAVPETPSTAVNHGVILFPPSRMYETKGDTVMCSRVMGYLQKPSMADMQRLNAFFSSNAVLIDTGVVIMTGGAFRSFYNHILDPLFSCCCFGRHGMARVEPFRFELYSDVLLSLSTLSDAPEVFGTYSKALANEPTTGSVHGLARLSIWNSLHQFPLYSMVIIDGRFSHLGTSAELLELLTSTQPEKLSILKSKIDFFRQKLNLRQRVASAIVPTTSSASSEDDVIEGVVVNCLVGDGVRTGRKSMLEHCILSGSCVIGANSVVSHVFGPFGRDLVVEDGIMVQLVPLRDTYSYVLLVLGVADNVKADWRSEGATICGTSWGNLLQRHPELLPADIWTSPPPANSADCSLWTARLFPVFTIDSVRGNELNDGEDISYAQLRQDVLWLLHAKSEALSPSWKKATRLSLAQLLETGDASSMFLLRRFITAKVSSISDGHLMIDYHAQSASVTYDLMLRVLHDLRESRSPVIYLLTLLCGRCFATCTFSEVDAINVQLLESLGLESKLLQETILRISNLISRRDDIFLVMDTLRKRCSVEVLCRLAQSLLRHPFLSSESFPRLFFLLSWLLSNITNISAELVTDVRYSATNFLSPAFKNEIKLPNGILSKAFEETALQIISCQVRKTPCEDAPCISPLRLDEAAVVTAPARIDLAGGQ